MNKALKLLNAARAAGAFLDCEADGTLMLRGEKSVRAFWIPKLSPHYAALKAWLLTEQAIERAQAKHPRRTTQ